MLSLLHTLNRCSRSQQPALPASRIHHLRVFQCLVQNHRGSGEVLGEDFGKGAAVTASIEEQAVCLSACTAVLPAAGQPPISPTSTVLFFYILACANLIKECITLAIAGALERHLPQGFYQALPVIQRDRKGNGRRPAQGRRERSKRLDA